MIKTLPILLCIFILACNNAQQSTQANSPDSAKLTESNTEMPAAKGDCSSLYLFREGAMVENLSYDGSGKEIARQVSKVLKVENRNGTLHSEVEMKNTSGSEMTFTGKYSCDGRNLYADLSSLFSSMGESGGKLEGDPISYPIVMEEGQTLPDAHYSFSTNSGQSGMKMNATLTNRKVEKREAITTPAGTFNCYKIYSDIEAEMEIPGADEKTRKMMESRKASMPKQSFVMYFDPAVSIVKVEVFTGGKLVSRSEITSIK